MAEQIKDRGEIVGHGRHVRKGGGFTPNKERDPAIGPLSGIEWCLDSEVHATAVMAMTAAHGRRLFLLLGDKRLGGE